MAAITIDWDRSGHDIAYDDWVGYLKRYPVTNVFHSWSYGLASADHDGFDLRRGYVRKGERVMGLVQAYVKRSLVFGRSVRILRGPIFDSDATVMDMVEACWVLKRTFPLWKGHWCTIMPELPDTDMIRTALTKAGLSRIKVGYQTIWLDLTQSEDALWQGMQSRWRNQVRKATAHDISLSFGTDASALLAEYDNHRQQLGFSAPPAALLSRIAPADLSVATAFLDGQMIAGTLLITHGQCATYQVGWSNDQGRSCHAHNLLLWRHALAAKESGITSLDLGGIDADTAPGVAHFKSGLGGMATTLVGTFM